MTIAQGVRHFALTARDADAEIGFHQDVLGMALVARRDVRVRGRLAELVSFGADNPDATELVRCYCVGADAPAGRRGSNAPKRVNLAVPEGSLEAWTRTLDDARIEAVATTRLGAQRLEFIHPDGIEYGLVQTDTRAEGGIGISGLHSVTISLTDVRESHTFLTDVLSAEHVAQEVAAGYYRLGDDPGAAGIELLHEPYRAPGTWTFAAGVPHHFGIEIETAAMGSELCTRLREEGHLDVSAEDIDGAGTSVWMRMAGGALTQLSWETATVGRVGLADSLVAGTAG